MTPDSSGLDAFSGLIPRPQLITERLDDVIGRNRNVGCAAFDHAQYRSKDSADGSDFVTLAIVCGRQRVVVPEEFVRAVYEVNFQVRSPV